MSDETETMEPEDSEISGDDAVETDEDVELDEEEADEEEADLEEEAEAEATASRAQRQEKPPSAIVRLYRGQTSIDFIRGRRWWFTISLVIILAGLISLSTRGLNLGIDFKGGQSWTVSSQSLTVAQATSAAKAAGVPQPTVVQLTNQLTHQKQIEVQADLNHLPVAQRTDVANAVTNALAQAAHIPAAESGSKISFSDVGPTWGGQVTSKAIQALIAFFILVALYISFRFEYKMAIAAIVAVIHDLLVTVGIYSLTGFQVTPDTVIAVLTVLGYSLYDTVVVFDRIRENSRGLGASGRITYSDTVNLSMNQTLARSINTSLVAVIPVLSVLLIGSFLLGATTLEDFGLALVIGLTSGAYSSIFIASPLLAMMKEREPRYITIRQRLESRGDRLGVLTPAAAAVMNASGKAAGRPAGTASGVLKPGGGAAKATTATAARPGGSGARPASGRPAPRPRKGGKGGKGGKGRRR